MNTTSEPPTASGDPFEEVAPLYDQLMWSVPYKYWLEYLDRLWAHHEHHPSVILDLACGTGTVSLMLARRGLTVTGADKSGAMLKEAMRKAAAEQLYLDFRRQDAAHLDLGETRFDTVVSLFDSLNNIIDPKDLTSCFRGVYRHLTDNALFVFDLNTEVAFTQGMFNQHSTVIDGPLEYHWKQHYDRDVKICTIKMDFSYHPEGKAPRIFHETHRQRAYEKHELREMLIDAGFAGIVFYDAYTLKSPKKRSDRIFVVATKKAHAPNASITA